MKAAPIFSRVAKIGSLDVGQRLIEFNRFPFGWPRKDISKWADDLTASLRKAVIRAKVRNPGTEFEVRRERKLNSEDRSMTMYVYVTRKA